MLPLALGRLPHSSCVALCGGASCSGASRCGCGCGRPLCPGGWRPRAEHLLCPPQQPTYDAHSVGKQPAVGGIVDVGFHDGGVHSELSTAGDFQRPSEFDGPIIQGGYSLGTYLVGPTDKGSVVWSTLQVQSAELPQDDRIGDEAFGLLVAPSIKSLHDEHPHDHLYRSGVPPELR